MSEIYVKQLKKDMANAVKLVNDGIPNAIRKGLEVQKGINKLDELESVTAVDNKTGFLLVPTDLLSNSEYTEEAQLETIALSTQTAVTGNLQSLFKKVF